MVHHPGHRGGMNTQQRIDRLEDAVADLGSIMEADGLWTTSGNPTVRIFGAKFHQFMAAVAKERS